jgi:hypothetical protein
MLLPADIESPSGPPLRISHVAILSGFSKAKIMVDVHSGRLPVTWAQCGSRKMALVSRAEAWRYLNAMGILADQRQTA